MKRNRELPQLAVSYLSGQLPTIPNWSAQPVCRHAYDA